MSDKQQQKIQVIDLSLGQDANEFPAYQLTTAPIFLVGKKGELVQSDSYKAILRNRELTAIVSKRYSLFPNEEALKVVEEAAKSLGFKQGHTYEMRGGNLVYAEYLSDKIKEVQPGDAVQLGFTMRNSIDGSSGFGLDAFTYRLACSNGAIARAETIAHLTKRHVGKFEPFVDTLKQRIRELSLQMEELLGIYQSWAKIRLNQQIAESLAKKLPKKYLPEAVQVDKSHKVSLTATPTLWQTFNDVTALVWHNERADMRSKAQYEDSLHRVLIPAVVRA